KRCDACQMAVLPNGIPQGFAASIRTARFIESAPKEITMNTPQTRSRSILPVSTLMMLATCASTQGFAQDQTQDAGWYLGASVGQTETEFRDARMVSALNGLAFTTNSLSLDDEDTGWKVLG